MRMETEIEKTFRRNAAEITKSAGVFAKLSMLQAVKCTHSEAEICNDCQQESDNLHYFSVCLGIVAEAVSENKAEELFAHLTLWAKDNLPDFPRLLAGDSLCRAKPFFPDTIENFKG